jgi:hypothetical protein
MAKRLPADCAALAECGALQMLLCVRRRPVKGERTAAAARVVKIKRSTPTVDRRFDPSRIFRQLRPNDWIWPGRAGGFGRSGAKAVLR